jgi:hypothetical protein
MKSIGAPIDLENCELASQKELATEHFICYI